VPCTWVRNLLTICFLPVLLSAVPAGASWADSVRGEGDFEFYFDVSSLPSTDGRTLELLQIAIPVKEIRYAEEKGSYVADVRISIDLRSDGRSVLSRVYRKKDAREAAPRVRDLSGFLFIVDSCYVAPGRYEMSINVDDMKRREKTLIGLIRGSHMNAGAKGIELEVPAFPREKLSVGDPVFVWSGTKLASFVPNPMEIYGLRKDTLTVLISAVVPDSAQVDSLTLHLTLTKETGEVMDVEVFKVSVQGRQSACFNKVDLATYPAGGYHLLVEADDGKALYGQSGADFSVAWELVNWQKPMRDILIEARLLLSDREFKGFSKMTLGEQEEFMKKFWRALDPIPSTTVNEAREKFNQRVAYADAHFGGAMRGALSDRGSIYVRFGPPDEIIHKPVPVNRDEMGEALKMLEDQYQIIAEGISTERERGIDRKPTVQSATAAAAVYGRGAMDSGDFEVWTYNFKGDPIVPADKGMTQRSGMRFLFVDKDGYGDYRLTGSSNEMQKD
jgi:GWxTD domain-containing protein